MTIAIPENLGDPLKDLARARGLDLQMLVNEVLRQFVATAAAITDATPDEVARTQQAMLSE